MIDVSLFADTYPNIAALMETMPDALSMMMAFALAQTPDDRLAALNAEIPAMMAAQDAGDFGALTVVLQTLGLDAGTAAQLVAMAQDAAVADD